MRQELLFAAVMWFAILSANLLTATRSPTVWHDEVYFADPAIHFSNGEGFRTTAWTLVAEDEFWPGLAPAYGFVLGAWLKISGNGLWQVRALPILLAAFAALWIWWTARRHGHVTSAVLGWLLLAALLCGSGVSFSYRSGRGDALAMLWWAASYAALASQMGKVRSLSLFLLGAIAPWCGAYLAPTVALAGFALWLWLGRPWVRPILWIWSGFAAGLLCMIGFYWYAGSWDAYVACIRHYQNGILSPHFELRLNGFRDPGLLLVAFGLMGSVLGIRRTEFVGRLLRRAQDRFCETAASDRMAPGTGAPQLDSRRVTSEKKKAAIYALCAIPCIGLVQALSAKWPVYYTWLAYLPALLALVHVAPTIAPRMRKFAMLTLACAIATGLPARLAVSALEWRQRDHAAVEKFVAGKFGANDRVVCDPSAYFALRPVVGVLYPRAVDMLHEISAETKRSITAVCVRPEISAEKIGSIFGGRWMRIASLGDDAGAIKFGKAASYRLVAYRKAQ